MSQVGNPIGGDAFDPNSIPVFPFDPDDHSSDVPEDARRIALSPADIAKIEAFHERRKGLPRASSKGFRELREKLLKELEGNSLGWRRIRVGQQNLNLTTLSFGSIFQ